MMHIKRYRQFRNLLESLYLKGLSIPENINAITRHLIGKLEETESRA